MKRIVAVLSLLLLTVGCDRTANHGDPTPTTPSEPTPDAQAPSEPTPDETASPPDAKPVDVIDVIDAVATSADGRRVSTCRKTDTVRVWDAASGDVVHTFDVDFDDTCSMLAFNEDGTRLAASGSIGNEVTVWDASTGDKLHAFDADEMLATLALNPSGTRLAAGVLPEEGSESTLIVWDIADGRRTLDRWDDGESVLALAWADDDTLWKGSDEGVAAVDVATDTVTNTAPLDVEDGIVGAICPHSNTFYICGGEGATLRDLESGELRSTLKGKGDWSCQAAFSPDGRYVALARGATVAVWYVDSGERVETVDARAGEGRRLPLALSRTALVATAPSGAAHRWSLSDDEQKTFDVPKP